MLLNHIVCKIIENIASTNSPSVQKFLSNQSEVVNALWSCYTHSANNEQLRVAALNAICMLSSHSISVFVSLIDKNGIDSILECLTNANNQIQHVTLTMISMLTNEQNTKSLPERVSNMNWFPVFYWLQTFIRTRKNLFKKIKNSRKF